MPNKRGRGRGSLKNMGQGLLGPTKDHANAPRVRGRPRGRRKKSTSSRRGTLAKVLFLVKITHV